MDIERIKLYLCREGEKFYEDFPMKQFTSMRVGGKADVVFFPRDIGSLKEFLKEFKEYRRNFYIVGEGTNTVVRDGGVRGIVISTKELRRMEIIDGDKRYMVRVTAGEPLGRIVKKGMTYGFSGVEKLAGIPGSVGGAIAGNAGLDRKGIGEFVKKIRILTFSGRERTFDRSEIKFGYRYTKLPINGIIVEVLLEFPKGKQERIREKVMVNLKRRSDTQPLNAFSAGSVFKNPFGRKAWRLIESAGLKGLRLGGARVSEKHSNFILNERNATADEIETLVDLIKLRVKKIFGIELEEEIKFIGEKGNEK